MALVSAGSDPRLAAELPAFLGEMRISYGEVPRFLPDAIVRGVLYEASKTDALLEVPNIARLHIRRDTITVSPLGRDIAAALGPYLRRTPLMVLMLLRGGFSASGAAVAGPKGAAVIIGRTVSGKSTLAAALMKRGLRLMADDAVPLVVGLDGAVQVYPVWPELILWQEAVDVLFGATPPWLGRAGGEIPWRTVARERYCDQPMPLKRLYVLRPQGLEGSAGKNTADGLVYGAQDWLLPYHGELSAALTNPAALFRLCGAIEGRRAETIAFPQLDISEMEELAARIIEDCGWHSHT